MDTIKKAECAVDGCMATRHAGLYCGRHYSRFMRHGDPLKGGRRKRPTCSIDGCGKPHFAHSYCSAHYTRVRNHGDVNANLSRRHNLEFIESMKGYTGDECVIWPYFRNPKGYGQCLVTVDGVLYKSAHRAVLAGACPPDPLKPRALHKCHNGHSGCVNPNHLYWGTDKDNRRDVIVSGRNVVKLNRLQVIEIKRLLLEGVHTHAVIAQMFGVSRGMIGNISQGRNWTGV